ncbi:hypothetical protein AKJ16_DCAP02562, partial [Drosera capensis]
VSVGSLLNSSQKVGSSFINNMMKGEDESQSSKTLYSFINNMMKGLGACLDGHTVHLPRVEGYKRLNAAAAQAFAYRHCTTLQSHTQQTPYRTRRFQWTTRRLQPDNNTNGSAIRQSLRMAAANADLIASATPAPAKAMQDQISKRPSIYYIRKYLPNKLAMAP